jgi:arylsulfatase
LVRKDALYFDHHLNGAVRDGKWKLVRYGDSGRNAKLHPWQLYDMEVDRSEQNDLAKQHPNLVKALAEKWEKWAVRARVKPWPWNVD